MLHCPPPQPPYYSRDISEMYDGILHKPLPLPPGKSDAVCDLLAGLLQKDQHRRLGAIADFVSVLTVLIAAAASGPCSGSPGVQSLQHYIRCISCTDLLLLTIDIAMFLFTIKYQNHLDRAASNVAVRYVLCCSSSVMLECL